MQENPLCMHRTPSVWEFQGIPKKGPFSSREFQWEFRRFPTSGIPALGIPGNYFPLLLHVNYNIRTFGETRNARRRARGVVVRPFVPFLLSHLDIFHSTRAFHTSHEGFIEKAQ